MTTQLLAYKVAQSHPYFKEFPAKSASKNAKKAIFGHFLRATIPDYRKEGEITPEAKRGPKETTTREHRTQRQSPSPQLTPPPHTPLPSLTPYSLSKYLTLEYNPILTKIYNPEYN